MNSTWTTSTEVEWKQKNWLRVSHVQAEQKEIISVTICDRKIPSMQDSCFKRKVSPETSFFWGRRWPGSYQKRSWYLHRTLLQSWVFWVSRLLKFNLCSSFPFQFDLQRIVIYCDSRHAELETCCDIPSGPVCSPFWETWGEMGGKEELALPQ